MKQNGVALQFADESLKKNYSIVLEAVKQNGVALQYADKSVGENDSVEFEKLTEAIIKLNEELNSIK